MRQTRPSASKHGRQPPASELMVMRSGGRARVEVAAQAVGRAPGVLAVLDRERGQVDAAAGLRRQLDGLVEQRPAAVDVGRMEHAWRQFGFVQRPPHEFESARAVAQVQVQHAGLARHQAGDVCIRGEAQRIRRTSAGSSGGR